MMAQSAQAMRDSGDTPVTPSALTSSASVTNTASSVASSSGMESTAFSSSESFTSVSSAGQVAGRMGEQLPVTVSSRGEVMTPVSVHQNL